MSERFETEGSEKLTDTILDALNLHAVEHGEETAFRFLKSDRSTSTVSYRELNHRARQIARNLLQQASPGDRALMMYPAGLEFIEAFLGCLYAGIVAVPAYPPKKNRNADRILAIAEDCSPQLLLCTSETKATVTAELAPRVSESSVVVTNELTDEAQGSLPRISSHQLAFLQYTSGSTAAPKGVMVTHGNMVANCIMIDRQFGFGAESVMVSWLPMFHDMGLIGGILAPLFIKIPSILMAPSSFLREPIRWLQAVTQYQATCTGAPNFAYDLCVKKITAEEKKGLDLSSLQTAFNGAEPVRANTLDRFSAAFAECGFHPNAFFPCYGMAETTLLVSGGPPLIPSKSLTVDSVELERHRVVESETGQQLVGCGQLSDDLEVRIVNPETLTTSDENAVGEIWVHGASVADGYWNRSRETQDAFRATLPGDRREWFRTGDFGVVRDNELYVTGRLKDLIIIRGRNLYPQDIEQVVERYLDFVEPNSCAAFSLESGGEEKLVVVAEGTRDMIRWAKSNREDNGELTELNHKIDDLRAAILDEFEVALTDLAFVRPTSFPRTSSGKVQRRLAKSQFTNHEFEIVLDSAVRTQDVIETHPAQSGEVVEMICQTLREWAGEEGQALPTLDGNTSFSSLGIDSLAAADVGLRLERRLGLSVDGDALYQQRTIEELGDHLARRLPAQRGNETNGAVRTKADFIRSLDDGMRRSRHFQQLGHDYFATEIERQEGCHAWVDGRKMLMMASYSYLGLINRSEVNDSAHLTIETYGTGAHGVRLLAGTFDAHRRLECEIAQFFGADDAIVYSSGFMTNLATVAALVGKGDVVIGDELNHASIVDGCKFSEATFLTFPHNDAEQLARLLHEHAGKKILVIVDAVYSMDGDVAPLPIISDLCHQYGALLMVDEAHSLGVIGETGRGIQEHFNLPADAIDLKMGTLSKSIASCGGFIAARQEIIDYLKYNARGFIFSAALPAAQIGAARKCLEIIRDETYIAGRLRRIRDRFVAGLRHLGFEVPPTESAIVPIIFSSELETMEAVGFCRQHGLFVVPVFYPAVPMDKPRIRGTVMASMTNDDIDEALRVFAALAALRNGAAPPKTTTAAPPAVASQKVERGVRA
ncbi:MAG: aminotransferase class I/II-fold pyridoxal phosphate-dependent enzyme [Blastopirellula sp. JB062]